MLSTREIKQRIRSITSIKQITRAMEMVAASRLKKVESRVLASRAFTEKMHAVLSHLVSSLEGSHPWFAEKEQKIPAIKIILITADKGLCGAYNNNVIQKVVRFIKEKKGQEIKLTLIGKKGYSYFSKGNYASLIEKYLPESVEKLGYEQVQALAGQLIKGYERNEFSELHLFFTKFHTVMQSFSTSMRLLPIDKGAFETKEKKPAGEYIFEPNAAQIVDHLFPKFIETRLYQCILESLTSEYAARRVAMIAATENAGEMIDELVSSYNKARQAAITKELLEVVSGAEALVR
ncbi:MAG: ATP synthase F1 subunit gamma [Candidatus Brocadia sp.]|uniref:ATP synthase gamma chain n=1 Tax=Candidatus Brocadia fulgida TaxID=380242 RepID=A0A0M2US36_9BACT|nr:MAG: F0F1 ATP synthase gamma subunit [Candidatus Brocadia fulgida]MCC6326232.1 ATP synthase F1 subunit gamma [Candidatus Brocadia sp.]MCE7910896.1 ATP synthase F1 subunit gamma [Candidatus Brocadia sp. AMX3]MBV6517798.1 ATP synthase gamma chain [Candidatus Brocadia fulgida]MDG5996968.1 ATP synthase F1 subunit gamma [Candidatus Brocadia sp.]